METDGAMKTLIFLISGLYAVFSISAAQAAPSITLTLGSFENPHLVRVGGKCARLIRRSGRETLYNACTMCRKVSVIRKRRGIATPARRTFVVLPGSTMPVPFRGPGNSRITSDILCKGAPDPAQQALNPNDKKCVKLEQRIKSNVVVLVNSCGTCRGVAVNRRTQSGRSLGLQAYKLEPLGVVRVIPKGADQVVLAGEVACKS